MTAAQILSAYRMKHYYAVENVALNNKFSIGLYFTAMMYNTILPGGIGGDGYKIYTIGRLAHFSHLRAFKIALSERGSGLFALLMLTAFFYIFSGFASFVPRQNYIVAGLAIALLPCYFISIRLLLKEKASTAIGAMLYSFPIQLLNAAIGATLAIGLGAGTSVAQVMAYTVIFMVSSVAAILPVSIGGAGLREITFYYATKLTELDINLGIAIAMLFFIISLLSSLTGFLFWHKLDRLFGTQQQDNK